MNTIEILRAARAKIEDPDRWCKTFLARDSAGSPVMPWEAGACKWCPIGAIEAIEGQFGYSIEARSALDAASPIEHPAWADWDWGVEAAKFNNLDTTTHAEVLAMFDRAIAAEETA